jgi:hypothetical protein
MILYGTHGTTLTRTESIIKENFKTGSGRAGTGIYFWRKNEYSEILAEGWYKYSLNTNSYSSDNKKEFVCISVNINVQEDNFLDLEDVEIRDRLTRITFEKKMSNKASKKEITALYDIFIKDFEKELNLKFYVWLIRVSPPSEAYKYPYKILGYPYCYVVNNNSLINITCCIIKEKNYEKKIYPST